MAEREYETLVETHFDRMERERQAQEAQTKQVAIVQENETKRAKMQARNKTKESLVIAFSVLAGVGLILGIAYAIYMGTKGPSEDQKYEDKWRSECLAGNGTWLPIDTDSGDKFICIAPGQKVDTP